LAQDKIISSVFENIIDTLALGISCLLVADILERGYQILWLLEK